MSVSKINTAAYSRHTYNFLKLNFGGSWGGGALEISLLFFKVNNDYP